MGLSADCDGLRYLRETLNPKVSGKSLNRRFSKVDLPEPEGPEITKTLATVCIFLEWRRLLCLSVWEAKEEHKAKKVGTLTFKFIFKRRQQSLVLDRLKDSVLKINMIQLPTMIWSQSAKEETDMSPSKGSVTNHITIILYMAPWEGWSLELASSTAGWRTGSSILACYLVIFNFLTVPLKEKRQYAKRRSPKNDQNRPSITSDGFWIRSDLIGFLLLFTYILAPRGERWLLWFSQKGDHRWWARLFQRNIFIKTFLTAEVVGVWNWISCH